MSCLLALALLAQTNKVDEALLTVAEKSGYKATARHADVVALCQRLAEQSKLVHLSEIGKSGEGRSIPLMIVADPPVASPEDARRSRKLVVLVIGNIHAGEVCGKEALPILVRELTDRPGDPLLRDLILAVVPIYNPDGNERVSKTNRPGQVGPEQGMGQRTNAAGLDLNRDFVKLEAPETRALVAFANRWSPHLFIDTHTTNGSHHRYTITYQGAANPAGDAGVVAYTRDQLFPGITALFERSTGKHAFYYGNFNRDHTVWSSYGAEPRFGTTYFGMRNRLSILSEAYAYIPYKDRVLATRDFVRSCLEYAAGHKPKIEELLDSAKRRAVEAGRDPKPDDRVAIRAKVRAAAEPATVLGYVERAEGRRSVSTGEPKDYRVTVENEYDPAETVRRPFAYLIPARFSHAIETLRRHGLELGRLRQDQEVAVETYQVDAIKRAERAFQGHKTVGLDVTPMQEKRRIEAGTIVVRTAQPLGSLAVYLLEPRSEDGLATWNAFDEGLEVGKEFPVLRVNARIELDE